MKPAVFTLVLVALLSPAVFAADPWVTVIDRVGTDGGHLTVRLNSIVAYAYDVCSAPQSGGTGFMGNLEPGDVFIEWDEDENHQNAGYYNFTGTYNDETPSYIQVEGIDNLDWTTYWTVHTVTSSGTLTKTNDCCNEHESIHIFFSPLSITNTDDVNDDQCVIPGDEVTYSICYNYPNEPNLPEINDVCIVDYLPAASKYLSSDPCGIYSSRFRTVTWPVGTVSPGDSNCITLTLLLNGCVAENGGITNFVEIDSSDIVITDASEYTQLCIASNPSPIFGGSGTIYLDQPPDINLSWCKGFLASDINGHDVYFGTDFSDINLVVPEDTNTYKGQCTSTIYSAKGLLPGKTYYWRIDEVNEIYTWKGDVWSFTTGVLIDDFQRYNTTEELQSVWLVDVPPASCDRAGSGQISLVQQGENKYMEFVYDKTAPFVRYFSEIMIDFGPDGADWTNTGFDETAPIFLVIAFKGDAENSADPVYDRMYIAIEDTDGDVNVISHPDPNAQTIPYWQDWIIPFDDLNSPDLDLNAVRYFSIGFGERCLSFYAGGGEGNVMFDDIRLEPPCTKLYGPVGDFTGDCSVDMDDMKILGQEWLNCDQCGSKPDIYPDIPDAIVDFRDFSVMAENWLEEKM